MTDEYRTILKSVRSAPQVPPRPPPKLIYDALPMSDFSTNHDSAVSQPVFVARQPIFDAHSRRVAYELLYRASAQHTTAAGISSDVMCSDTALHSVVSIGLDRLTGGATAFVNITREHLLGELHRIFNPTTVVLELLESIDGDDEVVEVCERAVAEGYTFALDDYDGRPSLDALLPLVKIVKLDVLNRDYDELAMTVHSLLARGLVVLAERVESSEVRSECLAMGCTLFQGYVFSRPETVGGRSLTVQQITIFNVIALLRNADISDNALEDAFRSNPSLSLALLRIVNSAWIGARGVDSIPHAIRIIGRDALSRWLLIMLIASTGRRDPVASEAVLQALTRGRFCELLAMRSARVGPSASFLVGLLSHMDVLLGVPLDEVMERLPVSADITDALLHGRGPHADILALAKAYEAASWEDVDATSVNAATSAALGPLYGEAIGWATERLSVTPR